MSSKPFRRKDLKHDEFINVTGQATHWLMERRRRIGWAVLAVALVVSVAFSLQFAHQRQEQQAAALLAAAMEVFRAPVVPPEPPAVVAPADDAAAEEGAPPAQTAEGPVGENPAVPEEPPAPQPVGLQFDSSEAKYRAALERFAPIVERYGGRPSGRVAAYYLGISQLELGDRAAAVETLTQASEARGSLISSMALYRLGQLELDGGNAEAAVEYFDRLVERENGLFPRDEALMAKARAQREAGDARAALATYQRVLQDFADSFSSAEARSHVEEISAQLGLDPDIQGE